MSNSRKTPGRGYYKFPMYSVSIWIQGSIWFWVLLSLLYVKKFEFCSRYAFTQFWKETGIGCAFWRWAEEVESVQGDTDRAHRDERSLMVDVGKLIDRVERMEANVVGRLEYKINLMIAVLLFLLVIVILKL